MKTLVILLAVMKRIIHVDGKFSPVVREFRVIIQNIFTILA
jgi:hypothetical protein